MKFFFVFPVFMFFIFKAIFDESALPDYDSYFTIYNIGAGNFLQSGHDLIFVYFVEIFNYFGFEYYQFRWGISLFGIFLIYVAGYLVSKKSIFYFSNGRSTYNDFLMGVIFSFSILIFFFEFYSIRLRAGLSISFFLLATSLLFSRVSKIKKIMFFTFFYILSLGTHLLTFLSLSGLFFVPLFFYFCSTSKLLGVRNARFLFLTFFLCSSVVFLAGLLYLFKERGENLYSSLNQFRFLFIAIIPVCIYVFVSWIRRDRFKRYYFMILCNTFRDEKRRDFLYYLLMFNYVYLAIVLVFLFFLGFVDNAGEAIVRVFTLSSVMSLFVYFLYRFRCKAFFLSLIFFNSFFFVNTVFLNY